MNNSIDSPFLEGPFARTRRDHASETAEDYLELIDDLRGEFGEARAADIAQRMQVSQPAVSKVLARLQRDGFISTRPYRAVQLTEEGLAIAKQARHRHAVVVDFLLAIGVAVEHAQQDAEGIEHHVGDATLAAMQQFLSRVNTP